MSSVTEIANLAISHLGVGKEISNFESENSAEANVCRRYFSVALEQVLRDWPWPFANTIQVLNLIEENPNTEWLYKYKYPVDCARILRILGPSRNDTHLSRVPYKIGQDTNGLIIYTDQENAEMEYTVKTDNVDLFPSDFKMALSFRLAHYIAPRLTAGDPFKMGDRAMNLYFAEISKAASNAANEEQPDVLPESEFVNSRE